jgi:hypothetical protein
MPRATTNETAISAQVDCDLSVRRGRWQLYALVVPAGDSNVILRLTDFKQTINVAMSRAVAGQLGLDLQTGGRKVEPSDPSGPCHGCAHAAEDHPNDESGCQEWHTKEMT